MNFVQFSATRVFDCEHRAVIASAFKFW